MISPNTDGALCVATAPKVFGDEEPTMSAEREKQAAAEAAAELVENGMTVGLGTGSTVAFLLPALARRKIDIRCVATSPRTEDAARELGITVEPFGDIERFDIAIDGADQIAPDGWLVKGGGAAHTREKLVEAAADRFVVIADSSKTVDVLRAPIPLELLSFGLARDDATHRLGHAARCSAQPRRRRDRRLRGAVGDPAVLAQRLASTPGVVDHGLFPPDMVATILVARGDSIERTDPHDQRRDSGQRPTLIKRPAPPQRLLPEAVPADQGRTAG